jgi:hypothetical protein
MAACDSTSSLTLDTEQVERVREMLLIGLNAYGELMRLRDAWETREIIGKPMPRELCPIDVTGHAETVSDFADALRIVNRGPGA